MITNGNCTIIRMNKNGGHDVIASYPCMWQEADSFTEKRYGEDNTDYADIYIPDVNANVKKGDYISRGELISQGEMSEVPDISDMMVVMSVARHDYGREDMRHVRIKGGR